MGGQLSWRLHLLTALLSLRRYHRVLQKGRSRKALKEFEVLRKLDPEAALTKLEEMERSRIEVMPQGPSAP